MRFYRDRIIYLYNQQVRRIDVSKNRGLPILWLCLIGEADRPMELVKPCVFPQEWRNEHPQQPPGF